MKILIEMSYLKDSDYNQLTHRFPNVYFTKDIQDLEITGLLSMPGFLKKENLDIYPNLKFVMVLTAGFDMLDLDYFKSRNITLLNAKDVYSIQIAEDVFSKILYFNRNMAHYQTQMSTGTWKHHQVLHEIAQSTVGILGTGSIGLEIAKRLKAFDARVIGYKQTLEKLPYFDDIYYGLEGLKQLLKESDYVIIALPLNSNTKHLIDEEKLSLMKESALIVNIARGDIIDQQALINALVNQKIRGACLDVMTPEPLPEHNELWSLSNVFITPHNAGSSPNVRNRLIKAIYDSIENYLNNNEFYNRVL